MTLFGSTSINPTTEDETRASRPADRAPAPWRGRTCRRTRRPARLNELIGELRYFVYGSQFAAFGTLRSISPTVSRHPGLAYMRDRPTLRGVLELLPDASRMS